MFTEEDGNTTQTLGGMMNTVEGTKPIENTDDVIDSRDVIARIEYLKASWAESTESDPDDYALSGDDWIVGLGDDEGNEIAALLEFASKAEEVSDRQYGETFVRDSYFEDYARELAEDIGAIPADASWPAYCIDWERAARELQVDYSDYEFDGVTYWARA